MQGVHDSFSQRSPPAVYLNAENAAVIGLGVHQLLYLSAYESLSVWSAGGLPRSGLGAIERSQRCLDWI